MNIQNDGLMQGQDGKWLSFAYEIMDGRLLRVYFNPMVSSEQPFEKFFIGE